MKGFVLVFCAILTIFSTERISAEHLSTIIESNITVDTIWTKNNSPYLLKNDIQVFDGVQLTIENGVTIEGMLNEENRPVFVNAGKILAQGNEQNKIVFNNVQFDNANNRENALLEFEHCIFFGNQTFPRWLADGTLSIKDSTLNDSQILTVFLIGNAAIWGGNASDESYILERNILNDFTIKILSCNPNNSTIVNNLFLNSSCITVEDGGTIKYNTFHNTNNQVIILDELFFGNLDITSNYWNTTDSEVIQQMIYDKYDNLNITGEAIYSPILLGKHSDTPSQIEETSVDGILQLLLLE